MHKSKQVCFALTPLLGFSQAIPATQVGSLITIAMLAGCERREVSQSEPSGGSSKRESSETKTESKVVSRREGDVSTDELRSFLESLSVSERTQLEAILKWTATNKPGDQDFANEVIAELQWRSSNILTYPFKGDLDYYDLVQWCAKEAGVDAQTVRIGVTQELCREILKKKFIKLWDSLSKEQREKVLREVIKTDGVSGIDVAGLSMASGAAAVATLNVTVFVSGWAFYQFMTTAIAASAGVLGVTLPWAVYQGATTTAGVLSGPVGWAILGATAIGSVAFLGRADSGSTTQLVLAIHGIQMQKYYSKSRLSSSVFPVSLIVGFSLLGIGVGWVYRRRKLSRASQ